MAGGGVDVCEPPLIKRSACLILIREEVTVLCGASMNESDLREYVEGNQRTESPGDRFQHTTKGQTRKSNPATRDDRKMDLHHTLR